MPSFACSAAASVSGRAVIISFRMQCAGSFAQRCFNQGRHSSLFIYLAADCGAALLKRLRTRCDGAYHTSRAALLTGGENMKTILAAILCIGCGMALAQTAEELVSDGKNTENVTTFGM